MAKDTSKMKLGNKQGRTPPSGVLNPGEQAINEMDFNMSLSSPGNGKDPAHAAQSTDHHSPALLKGNELRERPNIAQAMQELALHNKFETPVRELGRVRTISHAFEAEFDRLIARVSPNKEANKYRLQVYRYLEELLVECHAIEVVPFGSFALETYLPDGDIDICVFFQTNPSGEFPAVSFVPILWLLNAKPVYSIGMITFVTQQLEVHRRPESCVLF